MSGLEKLLNQVYTELSHPQASKDPDSNIEMTIELTRRQWKQLETILSIGQAVTQRSAPMEKR